MAKKKENWRERTRKLIRDYPCLLKEESACNGGRDEAERRLPPEKQRALNSVRNAISTTSRYRNGKDRLKVIELVYWKRTHDLHGAAMKCHYSYEAVQGWNASFIELVDAYYRVL